MANGRGTGLLFLPALALVLLAGHFLHAGLWPVAAVCLASIGLAGVRRPWAARVLRVAHGQPYVRLLVILGAVSAFTLLAAFVFQSATLRRRFGTTDLTAPKVSL
jgi:hypothetical protein